MFFAVDPSVGINSNCLLYASEEARRADLKPVFTLSPIQIPAFIADEQGKQTANPAFVPLRSMTLDQITAYLYGRYEADSDVVEAVPVFEEGQPEE